MAYKNNIPQPTDRTDVSQAEFLENFSQIQTVFDIDHETFQAANGQGKHKQVTLPVQAIGAPGATEMRLYANTSAFTGNPELFLRNGSSGTNVEATYAKKGTDGATMLPSGLLIKWFSTTIAGSGAGLSTRTWGVGGANIAFSTQYWASVIIAADPGDQSKDVNCVAYVTKISDPTKIEYRVWRRNLFNTPGTDNNPFGISVIAIGIP